MRVCWKTAFLALLFVWAIAFGIALSSLLWWQFALLISVLTIAATFIADVLTHYKEKKSNA